MCPMCHETTILDNELLSDCLDGKETFQCDNWQDEVNPDTDTTGFVYYDIINEELLKRW